MNKPFILVTNDDGFFAPGIRALANAMCAVGDVAIAAPETQQSGVGKHISISRPLRTRQREPLRWSIDGTPSDCVYLAVYGLLPRRPDLVISGINHGPNLAEDVWYSGTAGAALEGASIGIPSVAISHDSFSPISFEPAAEFAKRVARFVLDAGLPTGTILNVNIPETNGGAVDEYRWVPGGRRNYNRQVNRRIDPRGEEYFWIGGEGLTHYSISGSDCDTLASGVATITPIKLDATDLNCLAELRAKDLPRF